VNQKFQVAIGLSIVLHLVVAAVLFFGDFSSTPPKPTPTANPIQPIKAVVVDSKKLKTHIDNIKKKKADKAKRLRDLENKAAAAKKRRAKEERRIKALEKQRKKKEREKKISDAAAKKARAKANAADKARKKIEQERKVAEEAAANAKAKRLKEQKAAKKADDLRKKRAAERKRKVQEAKERAEQEKLLEQQMAEEMASRQQARRQQRMTEVGRFTALIIQTIQGNLLRDRSTMEGKSCKLTISLAPSGFVTNVVTGVGDRVVCDAAKNAVYKAGTLPVSKDPEVFKEMSRISLTVVPEF